ncbi:hypothetical protein HDU98_004735 [Podochytrium sp. JEL0797]|nr:hypothetical protein HDU98_004735 [Podochytrium sp. JEL0797]
MPQSGLASSDSVAYVATNPLLRNPSVGVVNASTVVPGPSVIYVADPHDALETGIPRPGNFPVSSGSSAHASICGCYNRVAKSCGKLMDNTELFFLIADALGIGDVPAVGVGDTGNEKRDILAYLSASTFYVSGADLL